MAAPATRLVMTSLRPMLNDLREGDGDGDGAADGAGVAAADSVMK